MQPEQYPRIVVAGLGGDSGKTLVSLGLLASWRREGRLVHAFKKGPDYIDAAWLGWAAGGVARNLDVYLMGEEAVRRSFAVHAAGAVSLIEGNRGLYDGLDAAGSASTAALAKLLDAPVVLVVPAGKVTATVGAMVLGCQRLDPAVRIAGVILNRVAGARHERVCREAVERACGVPVLGAIPRLAGDALPGRHLGLVTPAEHPHLAAVEAHACEAVRHLDRAAILEAAAAAGPLAAPPAPPAPARTAGASLRVGCFRDSAFTFYYPENLEALEAAGARIEPVSALDDQRLPALDLLYIGGGFPETHAAALSANGALRTSVKAAVEAGLPVYAECGGLMYLAEAIRVGGREYPMSGVLPLRIDVEARPQGHGYCEVRVDAANPFFPVGTALRGHEFHYSRIVAGQDQVASAYAVTRGAGCFDQRDGLVHKNVLASYAHLHSAGVPGWAESLCRSATEFRRTRA